MTAHEPVRGEELEASVTEKGDILELSVRVPRP
jgi:hypothetical protein